MQDVIDAYAEIRRAEERYRQTVREALAGGTRQAEIAKALNLTRETIRRDAMSDEQRESLRKAETERLRKRREQLKGTLST